MFLTTLNIALPANRLARMDDYLRQGLDAGGSEYQQRVAVQHIVREASMARVPVLEYLRARLAGTSSTETAVVATVAQAEPFVCDTCGQGFQTKHALCGHQKKHARL